jgi:glucose-induced degradation protein 8
MQGYMDAARAFLEETGMESGPSSETAEARMHVRNAVEHGSIIAAIERVNDLNPEVCLRLGPRISSCAQQTQLHAELQSHFLAEPGHQTIWMPSSIGTMIGVQILEENSTLFFHLQQQQLIELIRGGQIEEALTFAQEFLAYKGESNAALLDELGAQLHYDADTSLLV